MARKPRYCPGGVPIHVVQRGNNKRRCFLDRTDFINYAGWLNQYAGSIGVAIHAWVFMSNHVHLLMTAACNEGISQLMQSIGRRYVQYFNKRHKCSGTLWEGRFRSSAIETSQYLLACYRYIELNPVRAGIVKDPCEYFWSSYHTNALAQQSDIVTPHAEYVSLGHTAAARQRVYREFVTVTQSSQHDDVITRAINKCVPIAPDKNSDCDNRLQIGS